MVSGMNFDPPPQSSRGRIFFQRFVVGTDQGPARDQSGVFTELRMLKESGEMPGFEQEQTEAIFAWFNEHLPVPPFESADWPRNAISWFKPGGGEFVSKLREAIAILDGNGRFVRTIRTTDPGVILYEDTYQIVASSWRY
jgi:hypothetical protein